MKHFKLDEFRCRCCGGLPPDAQENIRALVEAVLDPARERYGGPVTVNSGFRCTKHNREVGGVPASQHLRGEATDVSAGSTQANARLAEIIEANGRYDQLVRYMNKDGGIRFIHVSWKRNGVNRKMSFNK